MEPVGIIIIMVIISISLAITILIKPSLLPIQKNIDPIEELIHKYPKKIKIIKSKNDEKSINISVWTDAEKQDFDNTNSEILKADSEMLKFVVEQLSLGKEVAILPLEKTKVKVSAAKGLFKK